MKDDKYISLFVMQDGEKYKEIYRKDYTKTVVPYNSSTYEEFMEMYLMMAKRDVGELIHLYYEGFLRKYLDKVWIGTEPDLVFDFYHKDKIVECHVLSEEKLGFVVLDVNNFNILDEFEENILVSSSESIFLTQAYKAIRRYLKRKEEENGQTVK